MSGKQSREVFGWIFVSRLDCPPPPKKKKTPKCWLRYYHSPDIIYVKIIMPCYLQVEWESYRCMVISELFQYNVTLYFFL